VDVTGWTWLTRGKRTLLWRTDVLCITWKGVMKAQWLGDGVGKEREKEGA